MPNPISLLSVASIAVLLLLPACDWGRDIPTETRMETDIEQYLTDEAARHLTSAGTFELVSSDGQEPRVSPDRAKQLAVAFVKTWGQSHRPGWEYQRGAPINLGSLEPAPRVFFADTPYELPSKQFHPAFGRLLGPWYIVHFESGSQPVLAVAVSAYSTDVQIKNGLIIPPPEGGTLFYSSGVAANSRHPAPYRPLSPEEAVARVASQTGAKIATVPELVRREASWHPLFSIWKLTLEHPVLVATARDSRVGLERRAVRTLYVGPDGQFLAPSQDQPGTIEVDVRPKDSPPGAAARARITILPGRAVKFDEVTPVHEE